MVKYTRKGNASNISTSFSTQPTTIVSISRLLLTTSFGLGVCQSVHQLGVALNGAYASMLLPPTEQKILASLLQQKRLGFCKILCHLHSTGCIQPPDLLKLRIRTITHINMLTKQGHCRIEGHCSVQPWIECVLWFWNPAQSSLLVSVIFPHQIWPGRSLIHHADKYQSQCYALSFLLLPCLFQWIHNFIHLSYYKSPFFSTVIHFYSSPQWMRVCGIQKYRPCSYPFCRVRSFRWTMQV